MNLGLQVNSHQGAEGILGLVGLPLYTLSLLERCQRMNTDYVLHEAMDGQIRTDSHSLAGHAQGLDRNRSTAEEQRET